MYSNQLWFRIESFDSEYEHNINLTMKITEFKFFAILGLYYEKKNSRICNSLSITFVYNSIPRTYIFITQNKL